MAENFIAGLPDYRHIALADAGSTNSEALDRARSGDAGRLWITADRQLQGRGRRGRGWISEAGNLYASLLLIDPAPASAITTMPLVAAVAVQHALAPFFADRPFEPQIKWPNDILVGGEKICGILLESETVPGVGLAVVIGCGINCSHHPQSGDFRSADLRQYGIEVTPQALLPRLAVAMEETLSLWNGGRGFAAVRRQWLDAACGIGEPVTVNLHDKRINGTFEDIDEDGHLLVRVAGGNIERISAGDLFFGTQTGNTQ